uniref:Peptidase A1 domain-containing protein n=1 Tax=Macrostomum lignano TaxID=282301 RepID=A0A1I8IU05_9PLAT
LFLLASIGCVCQDPVDVRRNSFPNSLLTSKMSRGHTRPPAQLVLQRKMQSRAERVGFICNATRSTPFAGIGAFFNLPPLDLFVRGGAARTMRRLQEPRPVPQHLNECQANRVFTDGIASTLNLKQSDTINDHWNPGELHCYTDASKQSVNTGFGVGIFLNGAEMKSIIFAFGQQSCFAAISGCSVNSATVLDCIKLLNIGGRFSGGYFASAFDLGGWRHLSDRRLIVGVFPAADSRLALVLSSNFALSLGFFASVLLLAGSISSWGLGDRSGFGGGCGSGSRLLLSRLLLRLLASTVHRGQPTAGLQGQRDRGAEPAADGDVATPKELLPPGVHLQAGEAEHQQGAIVQIGGQAELPDSGYWGSVLQVELLDQLRLPFTLFRLLLLLLLLWLLLCSLIISRVRGGCGSFIFHGRFRRASQLEGEDSARRGHRASVGSVNCVSVSSRAPIWPRGRGSRRAKLLLLRRRRRGGSFGCSGGDAFGCRFVLLLCCLFACSSGFLFGLRLGLPLVFRLVFRLVFPLVFRLVFRLFFRLFFPLFFRFFSSAVFFSGFFSLVTVYSCLRPGRNFFSMRKLWRRLLPRPLPASEPEAPPLTAAAPESASPEAPTPTAGRVGVCGDLSDGARVEYGDTVRASLGSSPLVGGAGRAPFGQKVGSNRAQIELNIASLELALTNQLHIEDRQPRVHRRRRRKVDANVAQQFGKRVAGFAGSFAVADGGRVGDEQPGGVQTAEGNSEAFASVEHPEGDASIGMACH